MEYFGGEVGQVAHSEHKQWLNDAYMVGKLGHERRREAKEHADKCTANGHQDETEEARHHVYHLEIILANLTERLEHVVQNL